MLLYIQYAIIFSRLLLLQFSVLQSVVSCGFFSLQSLSYHFKKQTPNSKSSKIFPAYHSLNLIPYLSFLVILTFQSHRNNEISLHMVLCMHAG